MIKLLVALLICLLPAYGYAGEAKPLSNNPAIEKRMIKLTKTLRCLVCQNESLAASHADLAKDLRQEVREMMEKGMTDKQIKAYLVQRYGDFVLYDPPVQKKTLLLWYGPFGLVLVGLAFLFYQMRKRRRLIADTELTPEAQQRAAALLNDEEDNHA